jgi:sulfur carrier protein
LVRGEKMKVHVNGEEYVTEKNTITQLLGEMGMMPGRVAIELNLGVIKRTEYDTAALKEGDRIEIVNFVGGG